jgi:hypothetical protein
LSDWIVPSTPHMPIPSVHPVDMKQMIFTQNHTFNEYTTYYHLQKVIIKSLDNKGLTEEDG